MGACMSKKSEEVGGVHENPAMPHLDKGWEEGAVKPGDVKPEINGVPESAARSGPKFFLVEHTVKAGRGDEFWGALGELMGDQEKFAAQKVEQTGLGIKNHQFMPITDSRLFCTWEVFDGTDQKVLQDYLDQTMFTKACCNALIPLNRKYNPDPNACATKTSEAVPYDGGSGANGCFLVKHYVRRDDAGAQGKAFWAKLMSGMADPDLFASWTKAQADLKLLNHIWFPVHDAFVICLWEADQSVENAAGVLQDYLDNDLGRGEHPAGVLQDYLDNDLGRGEHPAGVLQDYLDNDLRGNTGLKITVGSP